MHEKLINRLGQFIQFERDVRAAKTIDSLGFVVCNTLTKLVRYDTALLLRGNQGQSRVRTISGVSDFDRGSPLACLCELLANRQDVDLSDAKVHTVESLPADLGNQMQGIGLAQLVTVRLVKPGSFLVFVRDASWRAHELQLLHQSAEVVSHAIEALRVSQVRNLSPLRLLPGRSMDWRWVVAAMVLLAIVPMQQSVIASGQITARSPSVVSAGLNGVVEEMFVRPNEEVVKGQLLLKFDGTDLLHQKNTILQELLLAQERLRKARQQSLNAQTEYAVVAELQSKIKIKQLELDYTESMMQRLEVRAQSDGVVMFSRKKDWEGRAVATGEKILELADASDQQFEIWVNASDVIDLNKGGAVKFFPDSFPLRSVKGAVQSVSYFASESQHDGLAYRVVADSSQTDERIRLGMKGTVRLYGGRVLLGYHLLRKPLSALRRTVGV